MTSALARSRSHGRCERMALLYDSIWVIQATAVLEGVNTPRSYFALDGLCAKASCYRTRQNKKAGCHIRRVCK